MSKWQSTIYLGDLWQDREDGKLTIEQLAKSVAIRIRSSNAWGRFGEDAAYELEELAEYFENCGDEVEEFDSILEQLYDWGDYGLDDHWAGRKRCWIDTMIASGKVTKKSG